MSDFDAAIERQARGALVRVADLIEMELKSGTQRYWTGMTPIRSSDGKVWNPTRGVGEVSGLQQSFQGDAPELTLTLAGTSSQFKRLVPLTGDQRDEFFNRRVTIYWQFFGKTWDVLDEPFAIFTGQMRTLVPSRKTVPGGVLSIITLTAEHPFSNRATAPYGCLTPQDQDARYPGLPRDEMLDRSPGQTAKLVRWPIF